MYSWFEPLLRIYEQHRNEMAIALATGEPVVTPCPSVFSSFLTFTTVLMAMFGDPDLARSKTRKLKALRQTTSVAVYASEFLRLKSYISWNDKAFYDEFYDGL